MAGYEIVQLENLIAAIGEERVKNILSDFSCPLNLDVEDFIRTKAIQFGKTGLSKTHLVFAKYKERPALVGYYTLANKVLIVKNSCTLSSKTKKRLNKFGTYDEKLKQRIIAAPLIAQLAKNYRYEKMNLISGDELLELAVESVLQMMRLVGGQAVYLECEDRPRLIEFYERNGFFVFYDREMDADERKMMKGTSLKQLIRVFSEDDISGTNQE